MKIAEVSEKFDAPQDTIRYYERIGLLPRVNRNKSGIIEYTEEDCKFVEFIKGGGCRFLLKKIWILQILTKKHRFLQDNY